MGFYQFERMQEINAPIEEVWDFISSPKNLAKITPPEMGFLITNQPSEKMYEGMIISYKVKPLLNIPTTWVTEITKVKPLEFFIDEQRIGPYKMWHHEHHLEMKNGKVWMKDIISYQPPFGILGSLMNQLVIEKKLNGIFNYRKQVLEDHFR